MFSKSSFDNLKSSTLKKSLIEMSFLFLLLLCVAFVICQAQVATDLACPSTERGYAPPMLGGFCSVNGIHGECRFNRLPYGYNCTDAAQPASCYWAKIVCVLPKVECTSLTQTACSDGIVGRCEFSSNNSVGVCRIADTPPCASSTYMETCVAGGAVGTCVEHDEIRTLLCSDTTAANNRALNYTCIEQLGDRGFGCSAATSCNSQAAGVALRPGTGSKCILFGVAGHCSDSVCYGKSTAFKCPVFDRLQNQTDIAYYCTQQPTLSDCVSLVEKSCAPSITGRCLVDALAFSQGPADCLRDNVACTNVGDICIDNNLYGQCAQDAIGGALFCRDASDICPAGSPCVPDATKPNRVGICSPSYTCTSRFESCDASRNSSSCYIDGLIGDCIDTRCQLRDTAPCSTLGSDCVHNHIASTCGYSPDAISIICGASNRTTECFNAVAAATPLQCLISSVCQSDSEICYSNGQIGTCNVDCVRDGKSWGACAGDRLNDWLKLDVALELANRVCQINYEGAQCVLNAIEGCIEENNVVASCLRAWLTLIPLTQCVRTSTTCTSIGAFCIENNNAGLCDASMKCIEISDTCVVGSSCLYKGTLIEYTNATTTIGACDANYECVLREQPCNGKHGNVCYVRGQSGSCVGKSQNSTTSLRKCLALSANNAELCNLENLQCFVGCRYPGQLCGSNSLCVWPTSTNNNPGGFKKKRNSNTELYCKAVSSELFASNANNNFVVQYGLLALIEILLTPATTTNADDTITTPSSSSTTMTTKTPYETVLQVFQQAQADLWLAFIMIDADSINIALKPDESISRERRFDLDTLTQQFESLDTQVVRRVTLLLNDELLGNSKPIACGEQCQPQYECVSGLCVRQLINGVCVGTQKCVCDEGWFGDDCSVNSGDTWTNTRTLLLAQFAFSNSLNDERRTFVRNALVSFSQDVVRNVTIASSIDVKLRQVVIRIFTNLRVSQLSSKSLTQLKTAYSAIIQDRNVVSFKTYVPQLSFDDINPPQATDKSSSSTSRANFIIANIIIGIVLFLK